MEDHGQTEVEPAEDPLSLAGNAPMLREPASATGSPAQGGVGVWAPCIPFPRIVRRLERHRWVGVGRVLGGSLGLPANNTWILSFSKAKANGLRMSCHPSCKEIVSVAKADMSRTFTFGLSSESCIASSIPVIRGMTISARSTSISPPH